MSICNHHRREGKDPVVGCECAYCAAEDVEDARQDGFSKGMAEERAKWTAIVEVIKEQRDDALRQLGCIDEIIEGEGRPLRLPHRPAASE